MATTGVDAMPLYTYHCQACGNDFEDIVDIAHRELVSCHKCGAKCDLVIAPFQFKIYNRFTKDGEGFKSVWMTEDEFNCRMRDRNLDYREKN